MTYTDKIIPGRPCPKCGANLLVKQAKRRLAEDPGNPEIRYFVGCANFAVKGCDHKEKFTEEIKGLIDNQPVASEEYLTI